MEDYEKAENLLKEALNTDANLFGKNHPNYAATLNNLGILYKDMGRYLKAAPLLENSATIQATTLGKRHPTYINSLNNLALVYINAKDFEIGKSDLR